ncbi:unnamed protein product [Linum trigynum]|uniref:Uncharacterized protein n=1 Tax=Linum trigynum TaxID=586398 RepID=A0AAV2DTS0_9ROSI
MLQCLPSHRSCLPALSPLASPVGLVLPTVLSRTISMPLFVFRVARQVSSFEDQRGKFFWHWDSTIQESRIPILQN